MRFALLLALVAPSLVHAQSRTYPPTFEGARAEVYKQVGDVELKLWIFDPPGHDPAEPQPAIVFFFGGGWKSGSPSQFEQHCRYLAREGMVAMTADYRVRQRHDTLADRSVSDAKSAVRWIRKNASRLGVDPDRIVAAGGSAGGHLAACTGVVPGLEDENESGTTSSVPNAMALFNPAVLLAPFDGVSLDEEKLDDLKTRTGVPPQRISPIHHLRSGLPPTIIFHGQADSTVPYETVNRYTEVAVEKGNRCELAGYRGAGHGFFNYGRDGDPGEFFLLTVNRLHRFLESLGYIETPPAMAVPSFTTAHLRSHFDNSRHAFEQKKRGTVAFIGGSITEMKGYRVLVEAALRERFPETEFNFVNAGISSTCSTTGSFRLSRDVLSADPDLLFVEFAVNDDQDAGHAPRECRRGMEGILRHALDHNPRMDIVVTHFVNPSMLATLQQGETPKSSGAHEAAARHYGVSTIDLAREVADRISDRMLTWEVYGGTHPKRPGNQLAADMIADLLSAAWSQPLGATPPRDHQMPKRIDPKSYAEGHLVDVATAEVDENWKIQRPDWSNIKGSMRDRFKEEKLLSSSEVGAALTLNFTGTAVGLYLLAGPDAGTIEYSIDGGKPRSTDLYHRYSKGLHYPRTVVLDGELANGPHEVTIRIAPAKNRESSGHAVRILNFAVNGDP